MGGVKVDIGVIVMKYADADVLREAMEARIQLPFIADKLEADENPFDVFVESTGYLVLFKFMMYSSLCVAVAGFLLVIQTNFNPRYKEARGLMKMAVVWPVIMGSLLRAWFWADPFGIQGRWIYI